MGSTLAQAHCVSKPSVTQIRLNLHLIDIPLVVSVYFLARTQLLSVPKSNLPLLDHLLRQSITAWPIL